jgi:lipoprotein-anchoring transpeptidase ErfK/SrfK
VAKRSYLLIVFLVVALLAGGAGVYAYDEQRSDRIAKGMTVGGVTVGGLDRHQARERLQARLVAPLDEPVVVRHGDRRFRLTAREARIAADVDAMVDDAVERSRRGTIVQRTVRGLGDHAVYEDREPRVSFSSEAVGRLVSRVRRHVDRRPRDASVKFTAAGLDKVDGRDGRAVNRARLRSDVESALTARGDGRRVRVTVRRLKPEVTTGQLAKKYPTAIVVNRGGFQLTLYKDLKPVRSYRVAVGKAGNETPVGLYNIQNKAVNPAWNVPNSDWAGELAGRVIPSGAPENPLKARWMGIYDGAGIHGTDAVGSLGGAASHGCIRMSIPEVIELYERVPVGTPVYIA